MMTGMETLLEMLSLSGIRYLFGNPGSTELPFNDALAVDSRFEYILALQEIPAMAMADGYAMASGTPGAVCLHIACGLGNAMGMLYNAHTSGSPLIVFAGQQDRRLRFGEPVLEGDLVSVARPWTKWAAEIQQVEDIPSAIRRAVQVSLTPPTGPVFLSLPVDIQTERFAPKDLAPPFIPDRQTRPAPNALRQAAEILAKAKRPAILAGSRVAESAGAPQALAALAETLGAPIFSDANTMRGRAPLDSRHPLYAGPLPLWTPEMRQALEPFDALFVVGMNLLRLYIYLEPERPFAEGVRIVHLDNAPWEIGKNYATEVGLLGDPAMGMEELTSLLIAKMTPEQSQIAAEQTTLHAEQRRAKRQTLATELDALREKRPMSPLTLMETLAKALPEEAIVVQEAPTTHQDMLERLGVLTDPAAYFAHRGWALGWGLGCAMGVKLAHPDRPVLALLGDGAALYGIQGLWTAARYQIPVVFVIANNQEYKILKVCGDVMGLPQMTQRNYLGMDIGEPQVDFCGLARSFGVAACRVTEPEELSAEIRRGFAERKPLLIDASISQ